jgi:hypothetical protein
MSFAQRPEGFFGIEMAAAHLLFVGKGREEEGRRGLPG